MHDRVGSRLVLALALVLGLGMPRLARAQVTDSADCPTSPPACSVTRTNCCTTNPAGSSGAVIIPLDRCHQRNVASGYAPVTSNSSPYWCANPTTTYNNAMFEAFGLAYRMMMWSAINPTQQIPFDWIVNPSKAPSTNSAYSDTWTEKDVDLWVLASGANPPASGGSLTALVGTAPIKRIIDNGSGTLITDTTWGSSGLYTKNEFPIRGSAFFIPATYRTNFNNFWKYYTTVPSRTGCGNGKNCWDFTDVAMYEVDSTAHFAWQDFTQALSGGSYVKNDNQIPVSMVVNYPPPKVAAVMSGTDMSNWLAAANLADFATNSSCATGTAFSPTDAVACQLTAAQVDSGNLVSGGFTWAWFESTATGCNEITPLKAFLTGVTASYTAGNAFFFNESISNLAEAGCAGGNMLGGTSPLQSAGNVNETNPSGNPSGVPIIVRWPANLFSQYGDLPLNFAAGTVPSMYVKSADSSGTVTTLYSTAFTASSSSTLRRLMTSETQCGTGGGFKGPTCVQNPVCYLHDDYGHPTATSTSTCDQFSLNTSTKSGGTYYPDDDINDIYVYGRYNNNVNNGIVFYAPGQNITQNGQAAQLRMVLSALIATPPLTTQLAPATKEITRSSPIPFLVSSNPAIVQGSYEYTYVSYTIGGSTTTYQVPRTFPGIYTHDDVGVFSFPAQQGHFRAIKDTGLSTTAQAFNSSAESTYVIFDTATKLPSLTYSYTSSGSYDGSSRTIWTANNDWTSTVAATTVLFNESSVATAMKDATGTATTLGGLLLTSGTVSGSTGATLTADQKTLIDRVIAGDNSSGTYKPKLGGVDRSTAAVIGSSSVVSGTRPTVAYFGATDGMLHAVCADNTVGVCNGKIGQELWAFIPRVNLPNLRYNNARIDGSPRVVDLNGNFATCSTKPCWRTILTFQTGSGDATSTTNAQPAVIALDISSPSAPKELWEYATPSPANRKTYELGVGLISALGTTKIGVTTTPLAVFETNNGGTGSNGVVVTAINAATGAVAWQWAYPYPAVRTGGDTSLPSSGIPGGVTIIDKTDNGGNAYFDYVTFGDLYGDLWELKGDGTNYVTSGSGSYLNSSGVLGATPTAATGKALFSFSEDYHPIGSPPAIYNNGNIMFAVFAEGGYADTSGTTGWGQNLAAGKYHYGLAVSLNSPVADATFNENQTRPDILFKVALSTTSNERSYSEATVVGTQVFFTTDTTSVNSASYGTSTTATGYSYAVNVAGISTPSTGSPVIAVTGSAIQSGASSLANNGTTLYASSGSTNQQLGTNALTTTGPSVTATNLTAIKRQLWLRVE